jgi:hypothetical protein
MYFLFFACFQLINIFPFPLFFSSSEEQRTFFFEEEIQKKKGKKRRKQLGRCIPCMGQLGWALLVTHWAVVTFIGDDVRSLTLDLAVRSSPQPPLFANTPFENFPRLEVEGSSPPNLPPASIPSRREILPPLSGADAMPPRRKRRAPPAKPQPQPQPQPDAQEPPGDDAPLEERLAWNSQQESTALLTAPPPLSFLI